jgi:hypothetical protein
MRLLRLMLSQHRFSGLCFQLGRYQKHVGKSYDITRQAQQHYHIFLQQTKFWRPLHSRKTTFKMTQSEVALVHAMPDFTTNTSHRTKKRRSLPLSQVIVERPRRLTKLQRFEAGSAQRKTVLTIQSCKNISKATSISAPQPPSYSILSMRR